MLWVEVEEHSQCVQLEHNLADKAAVQTVQEEMKQVEEKRCGCEQKE